MPEPETTRQPAAISCAPLAGLTHNLAHGCFNRESNLWRHELEHLTDQCVAVVRLANQHKKRKQEHDERQERHQRDVREIARRGEPVVFDKADDKILQKTQRRK